MWTYPENFDVIVIGGGHAGCEAAHAAAKLGVSVLLLTINLDTVGKLSCNPAVGGTAKGHLVREIDALGGIIGKIADQTAIQWRMLNASKGPAVWSPRAQVDKFLYQMRMKETLEKMENLFLKQGTIEKLLVKDGEVEGVITLEGIIYKGKTVIISSGTFLRGMIHIGKSEQPGGRAGDKPSTHLSANLEELGFSIGRLKTGTPPRISKKSIDFSKLEEQKGDTGVQFSFDPPETTPLPQISCHITYTNEKTKEIVLENLHQSPMYSGIIKGIGVRYCPSIEDKIVRFQDKERHQIFLEPEGLNTEEIYANGISSSLPFDVQLELVHSIAGLEKAEIMRPAYAIEYDFVKSGSLNSTLETKIIKGLFFAGQINGTTGYEEAAAQGIIAGINGANQVRGRSPFTLDRSQAYIGVLIDELISKELDEPYRMFTSRAEYRLLLRQDNADLRLRPIGYELDLIEQSRFDKTVEKQRMIELQTDFLQKMHKNIEGKSTSLAQYLARPTVQYRDLLSQFPQLVQDFGIEINQQIEWNLKFAGYIQRQEKEVFKLKKMESLPIPQSFDYSKVTGLRTEAREKLQKHKPSTLGQASRISGVTPADLSIILVALKRK
ncbi:MAG: tRNA uridine-5-carboxymethylaminomethyl(34) synthesis enzyme MnmG [Chlamydiae bacterium]|nr:tRNA uridine-5-carboxymethylaminomethyl(34) synthesis enzyme MnmG [Chlamydiota bacterium]